MERIAENIISLGINCEVSFQIERYVKKLDASLFSWAFVKDDELFLKALNNIDDIFEHSVSFEQVTDDMFRCEKYNIVFHGRTPKEQMFNKDWNIIDQKKYDDTLEELHSRINYLKNKFKQQINSEKYTVFLRTIMVEWDYAKAERIIKGLDRFLQEHNEKRNYKLVIIIEDRYDNQMLRRLESQNLVIRTVSYFAPVSDTKDGADNIAWRRIFREFLYGEDAQEEMKIMEELQGNEKDAFKEIYDKMLYYEMQCRQYQYENQKLQELLNEKDNWIRELQAGKDWLEEQYKNLIKIPEEQRKEVLDALK